MAGKQYDPEVFTVYKSEKKDSEGNTRVILSMKPKLNQYGVKSITVEMNDGTLKEITDDDVFFLNDPREKIEYRVSKGSLTREEADKRIESMDRGNVSKNVTLKL